MRPLPRLESEPKSGAMFAQLFIAAALIFATVLSDSAPRVIEGQALPAL
jgi:hypothetical protein